MKAEYKEGKEAREKWSMEGHFAKYEYVEGPEATKNFERLAKTVFRAKKTTVLAAPKKRASHKKRGKGEA